VPDGGRLVIADTSPLQYLFQVGRIDLLPSLYGQISIPEAVDRELAEGRARGVSVPDPAAYSWIVVAAVRQPAGQPMPPGLGPG
jgi:predicted nucleic acid-binding protein